MSINSSIKNKYYSSPSLCKSCGGIIQYEKRYLKYCTKECKDLNKVTDRKKVCLNCNIEFSSRGWTKERYERTKCCSKQCLYEWLKETSPDRKEREKVICKYCKNIYEKIKNSNRNKVYCSDECFRKGHKGSFKISEEHKKIISDTRKKDWASGEVYKNSHSPFCKWYSYLKKDGTNINVQGTWELKYAEWLDKNNINFECHKGHFRYFDESGKEHIYLPDFYLVDTNEYIDIKSLYTHNLDSKKIELVKLHNPEAIIKILFKQDLIELGISL